MTEEELTESLGIDASELRALCNGDYDVLVQDVENEYREYRQAAIEVDAMGNVIAYFTIPTAGKYIGIMKMEGSSEGVYTYEIFLQ